MDSLPTSNITSSSAIWQQVSDWATNRYRKRTFNKDERIPARPGLLYIVEQGVIRLGGVSQDDRNKGKKASEGIETFLGFVSAGQPFEIVTQYPYTLEAYAHVEKTSVIWLYWQDLDNWHDFRWEVLEAFRAQHQRKLIWLSTFGQRQTIDRLLGFITLLVEEHGKPHPKGYVLPFSLTHAQIASAIGSTRVTITRLMGKLRQQGRIMIIEESLIGLPTSPHPVTSGEE